VVAATVVVDDVSTSMKPLIHAQMNCIVERLDGDLAIRLTAQFA